MKNLKNLIWIREIWIWFLNRFFWIRKILKINLDIIFREQLSATNLVCVLHLKNLIANYNLLERFSPHVLAFCFSPRLQIQHRTMRHFHLLLPAMATSNGSQAWVFRLNKCPTDWLARSSVGGVKTVTANGIAELCRQFGQAAPPTCTTPSPHSLDLCLCSAELASGSERK